MKKALSLVLALAMLLTMTVGFGSSAEAKNLLPLDEEGTNIIHQSAYTGTYGPNGSVALPAIGSWIADGEKIDGGWFPSDYMNFDTENVKFGTKSIRLKIVDKAKAHECANVYFNSELLKPNTTYTFQAYVKTQKVLGQEGAAVSVEARYFDHTDVPGFVAVRSELITGTKDWTLISISFTTPETTEGYAVNCNVLLWATMSGTAWFDGLALVEGDQPVDYASLAPIEYSAPTEPTPEPTEAPADPTEAPEPTEAPADPTEAPADPTEAPADPTEAPAEPTKAPVVENPDSGDFATIAFIALAITAAGVLLVSMKKREA